jgi:small multidrug resistance pump
LYAAAFAWLMIALPHVKVNQFYPVAVGFNILFTSTAAWLILSETISLPQVIGVVLIIAGIFFVTR